MTIDPFLYSDAAYVLGALSPEEEAAFESHMEGCRDCALRVAEVAPVALGLATSSIDVLTAVEAPPQADAPVIALNRPSKRRRWYVAAALAAAAAVVSMAVVLSRPDKETRVPLALTPVGVVGLHANADLEQLGWGTRIELVCGYDKNYAADANYRLVVKSRNGQTEDLGTWTVRPGKDTRFVTGTALMKAEIAEVGVVSPTGTTVLRLTL